MELATKRKEVVVDAMWMENEDQEENHVGLNALILIRYQSNALAGPRCVRVELHCRSKSKRRGGETWTRQKDGRFG